MVSAGSVLLMGSPARAQCTAHEIASVSASNAATLEEFGVSSALDGDTLVVGAWLDTNAKGTAAGAAYVYQKDQGGIDNWGEVAVLMASNGMPGDAFGWSVSIWGDTVLVGGYRHDGSFQNSGMVYVFERDAGGPNAWGETAAIAASDEARDAQFGWAVDIFGDTAVVGARRADVDGLDDGAVYVLERDLGGPGNWGERVKLDASDGASGDLFGHAVSISGDTLVAGAHLANNGGSNHGSAYVFERDLGGPDSWGERAKLVASDPVDNDYFGFAVSIDADWVLVGAYQHDHAGSDAGSAYVFQRDQGGAESWGQLAELIGSGTSANDWFGYSVAMAFPTALVGAYRDNGRSFDTGAAYAFGSDYGGPQSFGESHRLVASDGEAGDRFGYSVAVSGTTAAVGALFTDVGGTNTGSDYVFDLAGLPVAYCTAGTSSSGCSATLSGLGTPSATAPSGFALVASGAEGAKVGTFYLGANGRQAVQWGNGTSFQCVMPPVVRAGMLSGSGTPGACDGVFTQDINAHWCPTCAWPAKNFGAGAVVQAQFWYRDPLNTSSQSTCLSNALEFSICP